MDTPLFLADRHALPQVLALKQKIERLSEKGYAFGHQDTTSYGVGWRHDQDKYTSDVFKVVGDFPLVYGFDIGQIEHQKDKNLDNVPFNDMRALIQKAHADGGIITISWHADNPVSKGDSWEVTPAVQHILKGGSHFRIYKEWLKRVANFLLSLKDKNGVLIPVAFRPFHEMNGAWFWWGNPHCSSAAYKALWRQTLLILTDEFGVHNLLYVYAPNLVFTEAEYLMNYPGDHGVDMLGLDLYQHGTAKAFKKILKTNVEVLKAIAENLNKPYALTEIGLDKLNEAQWWSEILDHTVVGTGIAWVLLWRNDSEKHFFVPYPDQLSARDFKIFSQMPHILFLSDKKV
ncbi:glycoside hydrolase family 26 protein [Cellulophaga sp. Z1A5H]|uniref:glycoside hydrolase family 26 protein n=1 Tax=Cellulophaga sp. Z1A5H TaxID=2687291 RepID=UPI0013FD62F9|nr:glycosyl hydrolase [Cellulophaga sp. Z1A5H]